MRIHIHRILVEDYPRGYPQFAAFMCIDTNFTVLKRFDYLHLRSLLYHTDILAETEERLRILDREETVPTHLSSRRQDMNLERQNLLESLDQKLKTYGNTTLRITITRYDITDLEINRVRRGCRTI